MADLIDGVRTASGAFWERMIVRQIIDDTLERRAYALGLWDKVVVPLNNHGSSTPDAREELKERAREFLAQIKESLGRQRPHVLRFYGLADVPAEDRVAVERLNAASLMGAELLTVSLQRFLEGDCTAQTEVAIAEGTAMMAIEGYRLKYCRWALEREQEVVAPLLSEVRKARCSNNYAALIRRWRKKGDGYRARLQGLSQQLVEFNGDWRVRMDEAIRCSGLFKGEVENRISVKTQALNNWFQKLTLVSEFLESGRFPLAMRFKAVGKPSTRNSYFIKGVAVGEEMLEHWLEFADPTAIAPEAVSPFDALARAYPTACIVRGGALSPTINQDVLRMMLMSIAPRAMAQAPCGSMQVSVSDAGDALSVAPVSPAQIMQLTPYLYLLSPHAALSWNNPAEAMISFGAAARGVSCAGVRI